MSITEIFIMTLSSSSMLRSLTETRLTPITTGEVWEFPSESWQGLEIIDKIGNCFLSLKFGVAFNHIYMEYVIFTRQGDKERLQDVSIGPLETILVSSISLLRLNFFLLSEGSNLASFSSSLVLSALLLGNRGRLSGRTVEWRPSFPQPTTWWGRILTWRKTLWR